MRVEIFIKHSKRAFRKEGPFTNDRNIIIICCNLHLISWRERQSRPRSTVVVAKIRVEHNIMFVLYYESRVFIVNDIRNFVFGLAGASLYGSGKKFTIDHKSVYRKSVRRDTQRYCLSIKEEDTCGEKKGFNFLSEKEETGFQNHQGYIRDGSGRRGGCFSGICDRIFGWDAYKRYRRFDGDYLV